MVQQQQREPITVTSRTRYEDLKRDVLEAGGYSIYDLTASRQATALFAQLGTDVDVVHERIGYPWIRVRRREPGEEALAT